jgi:signal peptidase I
VAWVGSYIVRAGAYAALARLMSPLTVALYFAFTIAVWFAIAFDAFIYTRHPATLVSRRRWYSTWPSVLAVGFLAVLVLRPAATDVIDRAVGGMYRIPTGSMEPGVIVGDVVVTVPVRSGKLARETRVVFNGWDHEKLLKRVVALPGDTIEMRTDTLIVNGLVVHEPYLAQRPGPTVITDPLFAWQRFNLVDSALRAVYHPTLSTWGPLLVPRDSVFVLGDNRQNSLDSRYKGFVAVSAIFARPIGIYVSVNPTSKRWNLSRTGRHLD